MATKNKVKSEKTNGLLRKNVRFFMTDALWTALLKVADTEGRKEGRPKSVAAVMRRMLEQGVRASK